MVNEHPNEWLVGNHALIINFIRFQLIMEAVKKHYSKNQQILDVGVYPGTVAQLFHEYYPGPGNYRYFGLGLGFDEVFTEKMNEYGVELLECDLDPRLHLDEGRATIIPLEAESVDFVVFTDVVEHFFDPFYPLQEINRVSRNGAIMVLTTNNITRFSAFLGMVRGRSCNVPLINGSLFYNGDWRPHFREYSKGELYQLMEWAGFEVLEHRFYEAEFGQYRVVDGQLVKKDLRMLSIKGKLVDEVQKLSTKVLPHLRDNHIFVAKKVKSYEDMLATAPRVVNDMDEWVRQRQAFGS
jgi:SAM-dependent methyltransferase